MVDGRAVSTISVPISIPEPEEKRDVSVRIVDELPDNPEETLLLYHRPQGCLAFWTGERWKFFVGL